MKWNLSLNTQTKFAKFASFRTQMRSRLHLSLSDPITIFVCFWFTSKVIHVRHFGKLFIHWIRPRTFNDFSLTETKKYQKNIRRQKWFLKKLVAKSCNLNETKLKPYNCIASLLVYRVFKWSLISLSNLLFFFSFVRS